MKILSRRHSETVIHHEMFFANVGSNGNSGYGFPCNPEGLIFTANLCPEAVVNFNRCAAGEGVEAGILKTWETRSTHSAVGQCVCGKEVSLSGFTNTCECGRDYNMSGQMLAARETWGEETGESLSDILAIP